MPRPALQVIRDEHSAVAAVLRSLLQMMERDPDEQPERFFDVLRAMLFYIDEFPERLHHPKESDLLFPKIARVAPELMPVIQRLEDDHMQGEHRVRELQHLLLAWELLGEARRQPFEEATNSYVEFYLNHMRTEETEVLPVAVKVLTDKDWAELDAAFTGYPHRIHYALKANSTLAIARLLLKSVSATEVDLGKNLRRPEDRPVIQYTGPATYLRLVGLDEFTGAQWRPSELEVIAKEHREDLRRVMESFQTPAVGALDTRPQTSRRSSSCPSPNTPEGAPGGTK